MTYAAQLIDATKAATGLATYRELADQIGVHEGVLSNWRRGKGSPMPEERVLQLCAIAKIADPAPWLAGVHADGVKDAQAKKEWESLLDRLRPSVATVAMLGVALLGMFALLPANDHANAALLFGLALPESDAVLGIMRSSRTGSTRLFAELFRAMPPSCSGTKR